MYSELKRMSYTMITWLINVIKRRLYDRALRYTDQGSGTPVLGLGIRCRNANPRIRRKFTIYIFIICDTF